MCPCWQLLAKHNTEDKTALQETGADDGTVDDTGTAPVPRGRLAAPSVVAPRGSGRQAQTSKHDIEQLRAHAFQQAKSMASSLLKPYADDVHTKTDHEERSRAAELSLKKQTEILNASEEAELNGYVRRVEEQKLKKEAEAKKNAVSGGKGGPKPLRKTIDIRMLRFLGEGWSTGKLDICFTKIASDDAGAQGSLQTALEGAVKEINERCAHLGVEILNLEDLMLLECSSKMDAVCPVFDGGSASAGEKKLVDCTTTPSYVLCHRQRLEDATCFLKSLGLITSPKTATSSSATRKKGRPRNEDKCDKCHANRKTAAHCARAHGGKKSHTVPESFSESSESDGTPDSAASKALTKSKRNLKLQPSEDSASTGDYVQVWAADKRGSTHFHWWRAQVTAIDMHDGAIHVRYLTQDGGYWGKAAVQFPKTAWGTTIKYDEQANDIFYGSASSGKKSKTAAREDAQGEGRWRSQCVSAQRILKLIWCSEPESSEPGATKETELGDWYAQYHNERIIAMSEAVPCGSEDEVQCYKALPESFLVKYLEEQHDTDVEEAESDDGISDAKDNATLGMYMEARCFIIRRLILSNVDVHTLISQDGRQVKAHLPDVIDKYLMQRKLGIACLDVERNSLIDVAEQLKGDHPLCIRARPARSAAASPAKIGSQGLETPHKS